MAKQDRPKFHLVVGFRQCEWDDTKLDVVCEVVGLLLPRGRWTRLEEDKATPLLNWLITEAYVWRMGSDWHWHSAENFCYHNRDWIYLEEAEAMVATLKGIERAKRKLVNEVGFAANIGQSIQWATKVVGAAGVAIVEQPVVSDLGWTILTGGDIAVEINRRVEDWQRQIDAKFPPQ